jgi:hypothetical protein
MKIRSGFVSNSSSSSFIVFGANISFDKVKNMLMRLTYKFPDDILEMEDYDLYEYMESSEDFQKFLDKMNLELNIDYESEILYIGKTIAYISDGDDYYDFAFTLDEIQEINRKFMDLGFLPNEISLIGTNLAC